MQKIKSKIQQRQIIIHTLKVNYHFWHLIMLYTDHPIKVYDEDGNYTIHVWIHVWMVKNVLFISLKYQGKWSIDNI